MEKLEAKFNLNISCAYTNKDVKNYLRDLTKVTNYFSNYEDPKFRDIKCDISMSDRLFIWTAYSTKNNFFTENEKNQRIVFDEIKANVRGGIFANFVFYADLNSNVYQWPEEEIEQTEEPIINPWNPTYTCSKWNGKSKEGWF